MILEDSLKNLHAIVEKVAFKLKAGSDTDLYDTAGWAREILVEYLLVYQDTLRGAGISLPYNEEVQPFDGDDE